MKQRLIVISKIAFLTLIAYVVMATSKGSNKFSIPTTWGVSTNCSNAVANNEVLTAGSDGIITDPPNRTFLDYGLPVKNVRLGEDKSISGVVNTVTRECNYSSQYDATTEKTTRIYSCMENGVAVCVVTFTPQ